jgi:hypothetical protein
VQATWFEPIGGHEGTGCLPGLEGKGTKYTLGEEVTTVGVESVLQQVHMKAFKPVGSDKEYSKDLRQYTIRDADYDAAVQLSGLGGEEE